MVPNSERASENRSARSGTFTSDSFVSSGGEAVNCKLDDFTYGHYHEQHGQDEQKSPNLIAHDFVADSPLPPIA